jgi:class 3 adenylate cyclase
MEINSVIDASGVLPSVNVPTLVIHRTGDPIVNIDGGRELAKLIPKAELVEFQGNDHAPWTGESLDEIASRIQEFLTGAKPAPSIDRVLATVVFTDIASSTEKAEKLGDRGWKELLGRHNALAREEIANFRGKEVKTTGDGFLAIFDAPARAVHATLSIITRSRSIGLNIRAGVHIGEIEIEADDISGIAVNLASRTMDHASAGTCLVTRTVKDLVAGSDLNFKLRGTYKLKGISEEMSLYVASD